MKWRGGGFDNLRKYGKEIGQGPHRRRRPVGERFTAEQLVPCARPECGEPRYRHERGPLIIDHDFVPPTPVDPDSKS